MVDQTQNWSKEWKSSTNPSKQRKYRDNAPQHVKDKLVSANLSQTLRDEVGTRNLPLKKGDQVKVTRGDEKGNITVTRQNGTENEIPLRPSNLQLQALNIEDDERLQKYEVDDIESIRVDEDEMEEALEEDEENEMMQQMQGGGSQAGGVDQAMDEIDEEELEDVKEEVEETEEESEDEAEDETEESGSEADYSDVVSGTIGDAKDQIRDMEDPDYEALLDAEESNKNRKTLTEWLENKVNN
jgi:large subunit ribosomal protein L24